MPDKIQIPNLNDLVNKYLAGTSLKQIASESRVDRSTILRRFKAAGVKIRGRSEAELAKWSFIKKDRAAVERQLGASWRSNKGRIRPVDVGVKLARSRYRNQSQIHAGEIPMTRLLTAKGFRVEQQFPCGPYNIDVALTELGIAIEIVGSNWHPILKSKIAKRTKHLLDSGWCVIFVFSWRREPGLIRPTDKRGKFTKTRRVIDHFSPALVADYIVALAKLTGSNKAIAGQYGVIDGNGQSLPAPSGYFDGLPVVPTPYANLKPSLDRRAG